jgi:hypothetical protein
MFSLVSVLPSTASASGFPAFVRLLRRYYVAVRLPVTVHVGLIAHRFLPPDHCRSYQRSTTGPLGSRAWSFYACMRCLTPQGCHVLALAHATLLPSSSSHTVGLSLMLVVQSSIPSLHIPLSTLRLRSCGRPPRLEARMVRYSFSCMTFSFTTPCRFIPTHERIDHARRSYHEQHRQSD